MKTLLLLRHAKSSWENTQLADFERTLNSRGLRDAPIVGQKIKERNIEIDLILSSPAERTKQTANLVKEAAAAQARIQFEEKIYDASSTQLLQTISRMDDSINTVLLVGHNPGIESLQTLLTGEAHRFPTAALAKILFSIRSWSDIATNRGKLEFLLTPKNN
jgi:phosphohistidine phosphatase